MPTHKRSTWSRAAGCLLLCTALATSLPALGARAATTDPDPSPREIANAALSRQAATEGMVLFENDGALPMAAKGNIALFGYGAYATVKGGTGSGDVNNRATVNVRQGFEKAGFSVTTSAAYWDAMVAADAEQALTADSARPSAATRTAVFVLSRNSGEGRDRSATKGDYYLTDTESANLALLARTYRQVIVVLNVGAVVDTAFFDDLNGRILDPRGGQALDAMLLMSQPGQEAGNALVDVLTGAVTPSGKTVDTWASSYDYYPAAKTFSNNDGLFTPEVYTEGLYVGYRYFDSFYKKINKSKPGSAVDYPFGSGGSYTTFDVKTTNVQADLNSVDVTVKVTNTGNTYSGKQVAQVYASAPQTGLDKPYQQLAGYAKTDLLKPGQSQQLRISFATTELASYDTARSANVLDAGDYVVRVGDSSRTTSVAAKLRLDRTLVTEKLSAQLDAPLIKKELTSNPRTFYSYRGENRQVRNAPVLQLSARGFRPERNASKIAQSVQVDESSGYYPLDGSLLAATTAYTTGGNDWEGTGAAYQAKTGEKVRVVKAAPGATLFDVAKGTVSMKRFIAGLSVDQLAHIVQGASAGTDITPGVAGTTTALYESQGIPSANLVDGPAGVRITKEYTSGGVTYYQYATAWPIGTLLAQTWDRDLVETVGKAVGVELTEFGSTMWLAPGMNIHRDPLNGRNFEYFSEDPLVTGLTAAAETIGVQSHPGIGTTIKHLAANQQELERQRTDSVIGERALREIYLKGFEIAVKSAQPMAVMTSYNLVNGTAASGNYDLTEDVLRGEWGFKGVVMTDWGANYNVKKTVYSGNDMIMPGNTPAQITDVVIKPTEPSFDVAGLPVYHYVQRSSVGNPIGAHLWNWGTFVAGQGGSQTYSVTVDENTDLTATPASGVCSTNITMECINQTSHLAPWGTVDDAYQWVMKQLDPNVAVDPITIGWLTDAQRSGIKVTVNSRQTPGDDASPVTSYTVAYTGEHGLIRLGDLQRNAAKILKTLTHTTQFAELATKQGVSGITVGPYGSLFSRSLESYLVVGRGPVRAR